MKVPIPRDWNGPETTLTRFMEQRSRWFNNHSKIVIKEFHTSSALQFWFRSELTFFFLCRWFVEKKFPLELYPLNLCDLHHQNLLLLLFLLLSMISNHMTSMTYNTGSEIIMLQEDLWITNKQYRSSQHNKCSLVIILKIYV